VNRGRVAEPKSVALVTDSVNAALRRVLQLFLEDHVDRVWDEHRLAYVFFDEDTPLTNGKPTELFVCKCQEALTRRPFNEHLRSKYKEMQ